MPSPVRLREQAEALRALADLDIGDDDKAEAIWQILARPEQYNPAGTEPLWMVVAGRGFGKTRVGAEWARQKLREPVRLAVIAPTYADARDTCIEGESGLLGVLPASSVRTWNRSLGEMELVNGAHVKLFSADTPERLRGPQHHHLWADELAAWPQPETWDQAMFGLRLGISPQVVVTTTPKPTKLVKELLARPDALVTRGSTFDNSDNLAPAALDQLRRRYEGTRLGRQELYAELLEDREGALWTAALIEVYRITAAPPTRRVVVAIDPAVTSSEGSDETGIVACGLGRDGAGYVLADRSGRYSPEKAMRAAVDLYRELEADRVVVERNNGGDYLPALLRTIDPGVPCKTVVATRGKQVRAEPVASLYEQGRIHHVGCFPVLEEQMTGWAPGDDVSPDRMDALVWAFTELMVDHRPVNTAVAPGGPAGPSGWRA